MIISKTPYRVSLFGGSTDYQSFYHKHGSLLIGLAIDKYCYITLRHTPPIFKHKSLLTYCRSEKVDDNSQIKHDGIRGVLQYMNVDYGVEMNHMADLPAQTGIGSSSSFIVGLLNAALKLEGRETTPKALAKQAIYVERHLLNEAGGIQDQIWAAHGGFNSISINTNGDIKIRPLPISCEFKEEFIKRSHLIFTGQTRKSFDVAKSHDNIDAEKIKLKMLSLANEAYTEFSNENLDDIAKLLDESWKYKRSISDIVSSPEIDEMYSYLKSHGMVGGKLLGSGRSGFIFGIWNNEIPSDVRGRIIDFQPDYCGSRIIN
jgi:D-glycero-alpha-D-manno-heptose-7-phosphate kinase